MLRKLNTTQSVAFVVLGLILCDVAALPPCAKNNEKCQDRRMHPDLPTLDLNEPQPRADGNEINPEYWIQQGHDFIAKKLSATLNTNRAKNVIMFLGDGMGVPTIAAARNLNGGLESRLAFEHFAHVGLAKTYSVDKIVPDSACTATAYLCGIKGVEGTAGVNGNVGRGDCRAMLDPNNHVFSIAKWAMDAGKSAGIVTTTRVTHASPSAIYAHSAEREWEDDSRLNEECDSEIASTVPDIALQLIHGEVGSRLDLVMGGGKRHFIDSSLYPGGRRSDGRNLIDEYRRQGGNNVYVETLTELNEVDLEQADRLFALFQDSHMLYHLETNASTDQPTLEQMTRKAIQMLSRNEEGYFIFIEGGRIDLAHHDNMARIALDETIEFSKAIHAALEMTNENETLIVVTADHSHAFSYSGYPNRNADVFGRTGVNGDDGMPLMILSYANGPSFEQFYDTTNFGRRDPTTLISGDKYDAFPSMAPLDIETHGGDDVPVYANGPWSHLFTGVYEQNIIPHLMGFSSCLGDGIKVCDRRQHSYGTQ